MGKRDDENDPDGGRLNQGQVERRLTPSPERLRPGRRPSSELEEPREGHEHLNQGGERQCDEQRFQISSQDNA